MEGNKQAERQRGRLNLRPVIQGVVVHVCTSAKAEGSQNDEDSVDYISRSCLPPPQPKEYRGF